MEIVVIMVLCILGVVGYLYLRSRNENEQPPEVSPTPSPSSPAITPTPSPTAGGIQIDGPQEVNGLNICKGAPVKVWTMEVSFNIVSNIPPFKLSVKRVGGSSEIKAVYVGGDFDKKAYRFETKSEIDCDSTVESKFLVTASDASGASTTLPVKVTLSALK